MRMAWNWWTVGLAHFGKNIGGKLATFTIVIANIS